MFTAPTYNVLIKLTLPEKCTLAIVLFYKTLLGLRVLVLRINKVTK